MFRRALYCFVADYYIYVVYINALYMNETYREYPYSKSLIGNFFLHSSRSTALSESASSRVSKQRTAMIYIPKDRGINVELDKSIINISQFTRKMPEMPENRNRRPP